MHLLCGRCPVFGYPAAFKATTGTIDSYYNIAPGPAGCLDSRHYMLLTNIFRGASVLVSFKPQRKAWYLGSGGWEGGGGGGGAGARGARGHSHMKAARRLA